MEVRIKSDIFEILGADISKCHFREDKVRSLLPSLSDPKIPFDAPIQVFSWVKVKNNDLHVYDKTYNNNKQSNNKKISNGTHPICEMKEDKTSSCNGLNKNIPVAYGQLSVSFSSKGEEANSPSGY